MWTKSRVAPSGFFPFQKWPPDPTGVLPEKSNHVRRATLPVAFVAQWIEHQTSNLGVAGSSPAEGTPFLFCFAIITGNKKREQTLFQVKRGVDPLRRAKKKKKRRTMHRGTLKRAAYTRLLERENHSGDLEWVGLSLSLRSGGFGVILIGRSADATGFSSACLVSPTFRVRASTRAFFCQKRACICTPSPLMAHQRREEKSSTTRGFEPRRAKPINLAG